MDEVEIERWRKIVENRGKDNAKLLECVCAVHTALGYEIHESRIYAWRTENYYSTTTEERQKMKNQIE